MDDMAWIAAHIADIAILLVVVVVCALIVRGMRKGSIKTCSDCPGCSSVDGVCPLGDFSLSQQDEEKLRELSADYRKSA